MWGPVLHRDDFSNCPSLSVRLQKNQKFLAFANTCSKKHKKEQIKNNIQMSELCIQNLPGMYKYIKIKI